MKRTFTIFGFKRCIQLWGGLVALALLSCAFAQFANAQERDEDDPPGRVARLGHIEGAVSFQPAGESEWVEAVQNRPMTTGDKLWADRDSRAEVQLGSSTIDLAPNTGFSFLDLDDRMVQIQLSAGTINVRVYEQDTAYEIDTPNQAFSIHEPGRYRVEVSENGDYTVVTIRQGEGESTGNGQSYTIHQGQRVTFSGTNSLNADVEELGGEDQFDRWSDDRERRYEDSPSGRYCSRQVVGFEDLDEYGDWRPAGEYGTVWYPRVDAGWAPYREGHWAWIDPWGWTWVDDDPWGYAPFHYGRWVFFESRWGWVPGPREVHPVYAPALVAFVGGVGVGIGGNIAWFPLGPREVYVPSYRVSEGYVNRVNVSNTTVNVTQVTNVYNTTIVNNNTTINNVTYVNRNVQGGVTAVPQQAFATAQPVARAAVRVNPKEIARVPVTARAAVLPAQQAVLGPHANTANRVAAPPQAVASRPVIAKTAPPPPPPSFAAKQQVLAKNPGVPVARQQLQQMRAANPPASAPRVITAPPAKPAPLPPAGARQGNPPAGNPPAANERPGTNPPAGRAQPGNPPQPNNPTQPNRPPANQPPPNQPAPGNRPFEPPARNDRPPSAQPTPQPSQPAPNNRPQPNQPQPNRPEPNQPNPNYRPQPNQPAPNNRPEPNQPQPNRPEAQPNPNNRPQPNQPAPNNRPEPNQPQSEQNRPPQRNETAPPPRNEPPARQETPPNERQQARPPENRPAPPPPRDQNKPQKPDKNKPQKPDDNQKPQ